jgi:hypothetical protein
MPIGWICRTRTDGVAPEEPPIVLQYALVPDDVALKDVARFLTVALPGTTLRIVTRSFAVRETLRQWSGSHGVVISHEDEFRIMLGEKLSSEYALDMRRL